MVTADGAQIHVRAFVLFTTGDKPASHKLAQLSFHSVDYGCSKCENESLGMKQDGQTVINWSDPTPALCRSMNVTRAAALYIVNTTQSNSMEVDPIKNVKGVKWTELYRLPNFDIVCSHDVDIMHNIYPVGSMCMNDCVCVCVCVRVLYQSEIKGIMT